MSNSIKQTLNRYGIALLACLLVFLIRYMLTPVMADHAPLMIFIVAVVIAGRYGGFGPAVCATAVSALLGLYYFIPPDNSFTIPTRAAGINLTVFVVVGLLIGWLTEAWRSAQQQAEQSEEHLKRIIETMSEAIMVVGANGYVTFANSAAARLFGLLPSHIVGRTITDAGWQFTAEDGTVLPEKSLPFYQALQGRSVQSARVMITDAGGSQRHLAVNATALKEGDGTILGAIISLQDLTNPISDATVSVNLSGSTVFTGVRGICPQIPHPCTVLYLDHTAKLSGGEIALVRLLASLDRTQVNPIVLLAEDGPLVQRLKDIDVATHVIPLDSRIRQVRKDTLTLRSLTRVGMIFPLIRYSFLVARFARRHNAQIIHANSLKSDLYGAVAGLIARIPVIWHVRDHIDPSYLPAAAVLGFRLLAQKVPSYVVANSESTRDRLFLRASRPSAVVPSGIETKQSVIHDGLVSGELSPRDIGSLPLHSGWHDPVRIGIIGRLSSWKGQDVFLDAAARLCAQGSNAVFWIIGSAMFGEEDFEAQLKQQAVDLGLTDQVVFLGFQSDVPGILRQLDILVHASKIPEPFGQVVIEGMAEGLPVIATNGGGVREIISDHENGILVPMGDAAALAEAIHELLDNPAQAQRMAQAGFHHVRRHFTAAQSARRVEKVYQDIMSDQTARHHRRQARAFAKAVNPGHTAL